MVSLDAIKYIEETPDTLVFFLNGDSVIVRESIAEVVEKSIESRARIMKAITNL